MTNRGFWGHVKSHVPSSLATLVPLLHFFLYFHCARRGGSFPTLSPPVLLVTVALWLACLCHWCHHHLHCPRSQKTNSWIAEASQEPQSSRQFWISWNCAGWIDKPSRYRTGLSAGFIHSISVCVVSSSSSSSSSLVYLLSCSCYWR